MKSCIVIAFIVFGAHTPVTAQKDSTYQKLLHDFRQPPETAKPWVFWYWMQAAVSKAGILADLEAMKEAGIGGAYLMPIKGAANPPVFNPPAEQLSDKWWDMVLYSMQEAKRLNLQLAMHVSDGFALAGGPWIKPANSMQKVVSAKLYLNGGSSIDSLLPQPLTIENYYEDIAVFAIPWKQADEGSSYTIKPVVTTNKKDTAAYLAVKDNKQGYKSEDSCWIQYAFSEPFTCRSVKIFAGTNSYQANRLILETSNDGIHFTRHTRLQPARHGWQDADEAATHAIPSVTARYFRFVHTKQGTEPGAEDLDAAKWKPVLRLTGIELSALPCIDQYEGKTGAVWRISKYTTADQLPESRCVRPDNIVDLSSFVHNGRLQWQAPPGRWMILRIGHTSTGHTNATAGKGLGLECDKFDSTAIKLQFDNWFGKALEKAATKRVAGVLKIMHVDSWECGSQNWSPVFRQEFLKRRGYDLYRWLPAMAGIGISSADSTENFLADIRQTIAELVHDNFYGTLANLAKQYGCLLSAENVAPTMVSDGLLHFDKAAIPMGEFWWNSPTHDKPNDMLDAISGAHIYGKDLVQAEAFTTLRMQWNEHPGMLKTAGDRNLAAGINRLVFHVFAHNPWMNRKPGMTLDGIGLYFQRDQTWWKAGKAWINYIQRCQALLQWGKPVTDIAVFTGEMVPARSVLPERLVPVLPGLFGDAVATAEQQRLANKGEPVTESPPGVVHAANMTEAKDWTDPLRGYHYDAINRDALLRLATVKDGRIVLPGGAAYRLLVLPGATAMSPNGENVSAPLIRKLQELVNAGAKMMYPANMKLHLQANDTALLRAPWIAADLRDIGLEKDIAITSATEKNQLTGFAWTHRSDMNSDIYFISNQQETERAVQLSFRVKGRLPEIWNPLTGETEAANWHMENGRTVVSLEFLPGQALFIVFLENTDQLRASTAAKETHLLQTLHGGWQCSFDTGAGGPVRPVMFDSLQSWSSNDNDSIKYYSGTAVYKTVFALEDAVTADKKIWLETGAVNNIAEVFVNGIYCGTVWTTPYRVDITNAVKKGNNKLEIKVSNTWANRIMGDQLLPESKRITWTTAPYRLANKTLDKAGLTGTVQLVVSTR